MVMRMKDLRECFTWQIYSLNLCAFVDGPSRQTGIECCPDSCACWSVETHTRVALDHGGMPSFLFASGYSFKAG